MSNSNNRIIESARRERIPIASTVSLDSSRVLDEGNVTELQGSMLEVGQLQPIVVVPRGDQFGVIFGNHRVESRRRNGDSHVDAIIVPEGTTVELSQLISLHENFVRCEESLPDTMKRVTTLMTLRGITTFAEGAKLARVSAAKISRIKCVMEKSSARCLSFIHKHKLGDGICYEAVQQAETEEEQWLWLNAHIRGELTRADIAAAANKKAQAKRVAAKASAKTTSVPKPQPVRLQGSLDGIKVRLDIPDSTGGDGVSAALMTLARRLADHCQAQQPLSTFAFA